MPVGNNSIFGAFTLGELRSGRLTGEWLHPDVITNYGWFGGGNPASGSSSLVDRIDFSNDSARASVRGPLSLDRRSLAATGNSNYGWFGGGYFPSFVSTVDRITFANDSVSVSIRGSLAFTRHKLAATSNTPIG